jgi:hypothetical protein
VTKSAERSGDVTVRSRALNLESVGGGDEGLAFEDTTESVDLDGRPSRKVGEGALDDSPIVAGALAKEDGRRGIAVWNGFHVHGYTVSHNSGLFKYILHHTWVHCRSLNEGDLGATTDG